MSKSTLVCALFVSVLAPSTLAEEARVPISGTTTITSPGTYYLSRGLTGAGPLITVQANDVDIDLNGFTLTPTSGAGVFASAFDRLAVHDGFIVGGQAAVRLENGEEIGRFAGKPQPVEGSLLVFAGPGLRVVFGRAVVAGHVPERGRFGSVGCCERAGLRQRKRPSKNSTNRRA